jgi:thioredoxin-dependent peroxiredoxin
MSDSPQLGKPAHDFTLEGTEGTFTLSEHRGQNVILLFYPGDETLVCTKQFCSYRDRQDDVEALDAIVVGISGKDVDSKFAFSEHHSLTVPLLADTDHAVAKAYGAYGPIGTKRSTFIVDPDGNIAYAKIHALGLTYETVDKLAKALASLPARA